MKSRLYDDDPIEYLKQKGISFKRRGTKEVSIPCPLCNEQDGFAVNIKTGMWMCHRASCGESGNLYKLKTIFGDAYSVDKKLDLSESETYDFSKPTKAFTKVDEWHNQLLHNPLAKKAREYLASRQLKLSTIKLGKLGWIPHPPNGNRSSNLSRVKRNGDTSESASGNGLITIPFFYNKEEISPIMVKLRWVPPEPERKGKKIRYQRIAGGESILYSPLGLDKLNPAKTLLLIGGELDVLSCVQALSADDPATPFSILASPGGESGWNSKFTSLLENFEDIVVLFDNDAAGNKGAVKVSAELGRHRCRIASWPIGVKDANDCLMQGKLNTESIQKMIDSSRSAAAKGVTKAGDFTEFMVARLFGSPETTKGWSTGFEKLDERLGGGFRAGEMTVLTGETGTGKTTVAIQFAINQMMIGNKVLFMPFEGGPQAHLNTFLWQSLMYNPADSTEEKVREILEKHNEQLYIFKHKGQVEIPKLQETLLYVVRRLDVQFVIIDHLDFMVGRGKGQWDRKDQLIQTLQESVQDCDAHFLVINHPNDADHGRGSSKHSRDERIVQLRDLKGHSTIRQDVANVLSVWRPRSIDRDSVGEDEYYPSAIVVLKCREHGIGEGLVDMRFHAVSRRYFSV